MQYGAAAGVQDTHDCMASSGVLYESSPDGQWVARDGESRVFASGCEAICPPVTLSVPGIIAFGFPQQVCLASLLRCACSRHSRHVTLPLASITVMGFMCKLERPMEHIGTLRPHFKWCWVAALMQHAACKLAMQPATALKAVPGALSGRLVCIISSSPAPLCKSARSTDWLYYIYVCIHIAV